MIKYERGLSHSYVVFTDEEERADDLSLNMLRENEIEGLLPAKVSVNNAVAEVAYEISGYRSMAKIFENLRIFNEQIMVLLETLLELTEILGAYYLEPEYLVLDPENIYWNEDLTQVFFCYDPTTEEGNKKGIIKLSELILERADYSDYKSVVYAYEFHQAVKLDNFSLSSIIEKLNEVGVPSYYNKGSKPYIVADNSQEFYREPEKKEAVNEKEKETLEKPAAPEKTDSIMQEMAELLDSESEDDWENEEPSGKLFGFTRKKKTKKDKPKKQECSEEDDLMEESFFHVGKVDSPGENRIYEVKRIEIRAVNSAKENITVENYPFLVGSLQYAVDGCIDSPDISRFHARFDQNMGKVYLSDLNSASGTYLNGEKLKGSVQKEIKTGDKISFGKQEYVVA